MISQPQARELIRLATLAPSGHNTQPWKFFIDANIIRIYPDYSRRLPIVDPDDHALFISLGCALEKGTRQRVEGRRILGKRIQRIEGVPEVDLVSHYPDGYEG